MAKEQESGKKVLRIGKDKVLMALVATPDGNYKLIFDTDMDNIDYAYTMSILQKFVSNKTEAPRQTGPDLPC